MRLRLTEQHPDPVDAALLAADPAVDVGHLGGDVLRAALPVELLAEPAQPVSGSAERARAAPAASAYAWPSAGARGSVVALLGEHDAVRAGGQRLGAVRGLADVLDLHGDRAAVDDCPGRCGSTRAAASCRSPVARPRRRAAKRPRDCAGGPAARGAAGAEPVPPEPEDESFRPLEVEPPRRSNRPRSEPASRSAPTAAAARTGRSGRRSRGERVMAVGRGPSRRFLLPGAPGSRNRSRFLG